MNVPSKPASIDVEIHGNFVDGREVEAGNGAMIDVRCEETCTSFLVARASKATHGEGKIAFSMSAATASPSPQAPQTSAGGPLVPAAVVTYIGEWGIPTAAFALLVLFVAAVGFQVFLRRRR